MITRYCLIRNRSIIVNGKILFTDAHGSLDDFLLKAYTFLAIDYPKYYKMDNLSKLGFLATEMLLSDRKITEEYPEENVALVLSNASSSLDTDKRYWESAKTAASPALFVYTLPNIVTGEICIRHKLKGENAFFITPEFDAALLVSYVNSLLTPEALNMGSATSVACVAGWVEVLGEHHDVFLYLTEKNKPVLVGHMPEQLNEIYHRTLWKN